MPFDHEPSDLPDGDPDVDRLLSGAGRFSPQRGFEDRVVNRVRVPLPAWARGLRNRWVGLTSGVSGWTVLATFSLATAAVWGSGIAIGLRFWSEVSAASGLALGQAGDLARRIVAGGFGPGWQIARAEIAGWLQSVGLDAGTVVVGYGIVTLVCAVALRWLTAEPAKRRGTINAAS